MSPHASFIPPDVTPPDPLEAKVAAFVFSTFMSAVLILFIGYVCIDFLTDSVWRSSPHDALHAHTFSEQHEPRIAEFLGCAPLSLDTGDGYDLTEEDRERAIRRLQDMFQQTESVSVEIFYWDDRQQYATEKHWLCYGDDLATELCEQVHFINNTFIVPASDVDVPDVVFTFSPSEVKINFRENLRALLVGELAMNVTLGSGTQQWDGNFGDGMKAALLNARLRSGETVRSRVAARLPFFPLDAKL